MIRIDKPPKPPDVLLNRGVKQTKKDKAAYDNDPDGYRSGNQKFQFKNTIYGHESVKQVLLNAQHDKCCYCEVKGGTKEVEHYRPKGAVKEARGTKEKFPGYYWLAYEWDNLLMSCGDCNRNKSSLFPLIDESRRVYNHHDNIEDEKPLIINPVKDDPRKHILYSRQEPIPITELGQKTIECLKLRNHNLQESRLRWLNILEILCDIILEGENSDDPNMQDPIQKARQQLKIATSPESEFSSMAQDFLRPRVSVQRQTHN